MKKNKDPACTCGKQSENDDSLQFVEVHDSMIPFSIEILWKQWFCLSIKGNVEVKYLIEQLEVEDLRYGKWCFTNNEADFNVMVPYNEAGEGMFNPNFRMIQRGMTQRSTRRVQVGHSIPFIPKTTYSVHTYRILKINDKHMSIELEIDNEALGVLTTVQLCLTEYNVGDGGQPQTKLLVYAKAKIVKHVAFLVPKALIESATIDGIRKYYADLSDQLYENIV
ncbi:hypothetical protein BC833DRAFT_600547, partial [Globomyces pollinis-pini]